MTLKRWQQYGIAISVAWAIGVASYVRYHELPKAQAYATQKYFVCVEQLKTSGKKDINPCIEQVENDWDEWMNRKWSTIALIVLPPIGLGWLVAFAANFLYRKRKTAPVQAP